MNQPPQKKVILIEIKDGVFTVYNKKQNQVMPIKGNVLVLN